MMAGPRLEHGYHLICKEAERGEYLVRLLKARLPGPLHWIIRKPRLLRIAARIAPSLKPQMVATPVGATTEEEAIAKSKQWLAEQAARGTKLSGGYVFTYTDDRGWPSEVYGPAT